MLRHRVAELGGGLALHGGMWRYIRASRSRPPPRMSQSLTVAIVVRRSPGISDDSVMFARRGSRSRALLVGERLRWPAGKDGIEVEENLDPRHLGSTALRFGDFPKSFYGMSLHHWIPPAAARR